MLAGVLSVAAAAGMLAAGYASIRRELDRQSRRIEELSREVAELRERLTVTPQTGRQSSVAEVYFTRSTPRGEIELVRVERPIPAPSTPEEQLKLAITALLEGPSGQRLYTQVPEGTRLLGARIEGDTAYLDFSREFEQTAGTMRLAGLIRQVVYTATGVPPVRRVVLLVEGERVGTEQHPFTGDGLLFGELSRERLPL